MRLPLLHCREARQTLLTDGHGLDGAGWAIQRLRGTQAAQVQEGGSLRPSHAECLAPRLVGALRFGSHCKRLDGPRVCFPGYICCA